MQEYKYAHDFQNNFVDAEFLPDELSGTTFYKPGSNAREKALSDFLKNRWKQKYDF